MTRLAEAIGGGLLAGVAGTAAMTASSTLEAKLRDRGSSSAPADAASKVLGVEPTDPERFSTIVHWSYGTGWGLARGVLALAGLRGPKAAAAHFATVWGWSLIMLPALDVAPPVWEQPPQEVAIDALHHAVYAGATSAAFAALA
jgi:hypothetical protein